MLIIAFSMAVSLQDYFIFELCAQRRPEAGSKVSVAEYVLSAYDKRKKEEESNEAPSQSRYFEATVKLKAFVKKCKNPDQMNADVEKVKGKIYSHIPTKKLLRSEIPVNHKVFLDKADIEVSGQPPFPEKRWMKETLIHALIKLENTGKKKVLMINVLKVGKTTYSDNSGIYRMYSNRKQNKVVLGRGRPSDLTIDVAVDTVRAVLQNCSNSSSTFKLQDLKDAYIAKKREQA